MKNMGGLGGLMDKLPSIGGVNLSQMGHAQGAAEKQFKQMEAIINSMTPAERRNPDIISGSRKQYRHGLRHPGAGYRAVDQAAQADAEDDEEGHRQGRHGCKMMRGMGGMFPGGGMPKF